MSRRLTQVSSLFNTPGQESLAKVSLVVLSGLLYSITIASVRVAGGYMQPTALTALRLGIASAVLCVVLAFLKPQYRWRTKDVVNLCIVSVLTVALPFYGTATAVQYISSSLAAILYNLMPPFTVVLAHFLVINERLNSAKVVGTVVSVFGASILLLSGSSGLASGDSQGWIGQLVVIGVSLSSALGVIHIRNTLSDVNPFILATGVALISLVVFVPLFLLSGDVAVVVTYPVEAWIAVGLSAISGPVAAFCLLFYLTNKYSASLAGFSGITTPLFSVLIGVLFLSEALTPYMVAGTVLLLVGVWSLNRF